VREKPPVTSRRRVVITVLAAVVLGLLAFFAIGKVTSYTRLLDEVNDADWRWLPVLAAGEVLAYAGYILAYRDLARVDAGPELRYGVITRIVATGFGAFVLTSAGGPAVDFWALSRAGLSRNEAVTRVLAMNTMKFGALGFGAALASVVLLAGVGSHTPLAFALPWIAVVSICVALAVWLSGPGFQTRFAAPKGDHAHGPHCGLRGFEHCLSYLVREGLHDAIRGVVYVRHVLAQPVKYTAGVFGYPIYWAGDILCLWGGLRAFGGHVGVAELVLAYCTGYVVTILPLPGGGTGGVEAAMTYALHAVGVPLAPALLGVILYRLVNFWLPILPATLVLPTLRRLEGQLRAGAATTADVPAPG
jgi:uncharacterized membrane protein YbhN (UPF0104 family)